MPPTVTPFYLYWTSNSFHPSPREQDQPPPKLLLISVRASLFDSLQMSLTPCKQDTHTQILPRNHKVKCGCNLCHETRPLLASSFSETSTSRASRLCLISDCLTYQPVVWHLTPDRNSEDGSPRTKALHLNTASNGLNQSPISESYICVIHTAYQFNFSHLHCNPLLQRVSPTTVLLH